MNFAFIADRDYSVLDSEKGMVSAHQDSFAGQNIRAALTHQDGADLSRTAGGNLDTKILRVGIPVIFR